jgi:hypothetical protein
MRVKETVNLFFDILSSLVNIKAVRCYICGSRIITLIPREYIVPE